MGRQAALIYIHAGQKEDATILTSVAEEKRRAAVRFSGGEDRCTIHTVRPAPSADDLQTDKPEFTFGPYLHSDNDLLVYQFHGQTVATY
jgi:hypothetical protein